MVVVMMIIIIIIKWIGPYNSYFLPQIWQRTKRNNHENYLSHKRTCRLSTIATELKRSGSTEVQCNFVNQFEISFRIFLITSVYCLNLRVFTSLDLLNGNQPKPGRRTELFISLKYILIYKIFAEIYK
jgi:hypothetical protein